MNKTFNLLFFVKKSKIKADGTVPIYLRITIDGIPKEIASKCNILDKKISEDMMILKSKFKGSGEISGQNKNQAG